MPWGVETLKWRLRASMSPLGRMPLVLVACCLVGCPAPKSERIEWLTMGTVAAVQYEDSRDVALDGVAPARTKSAFSEVANRLNAHSPDSEISRLASSPEPVILERCDTAMRPCHVAAFDLMRASGGAFNPRWQGPDRLDLGAIAKGFAVDRAYGAFEDLRSRTGWRLLIDLGGNLRSVKGDWQVGVKDPNGDGTVAQVTLHDGEALATSATYYRGQHIHDGRMGAPVTNGVVSVTVLCRSAMWADGLSTTLFVLGPEAGEDFMDRYGRSLCGEGPVSVLWILENGIRRVYGEPRF